ncbi:HesA/MoeB/ThiF family protein [Desulfopila aestuarii]|uniref:Molybdopterin or thiamine biosynthesis adenylyltransferase n=1 Tax=Desulfopila aestuarii DSM 18488 TaxID=1121416 RepID=A0A1M7Y416_9BACT|nr:HesA/MoeB/ThiF family protein [Desulfopila aestuarii]SHO46834.1 Molybdopterin or thiamine biosynthesis adenylyltransferase [Desulfopila aestuarii DSM 18488]
MNTPNKKEPHSTSTAATDSGLLTEISRKAIKCNRPDSSEYLGLLYQDEMQIVQLTGYSHREVQVTALNNQIIPERYARNQRSISNEEQIRLLQTHVAIIGLGGLGGAVTEILARIGIGMLTLVDGDHFEDSNLNRQLLSSTDMLGRKKAEVAADRVASINPAVETRIFTEFFTQDNGSEILSGVNIGVDCLDTITARFVLEECCRTHDIPMVSAAIGGTSGQATVIQPGDPGLQLIYGDPSKAPQKGVEATLGTLPFAATAMAAIECAEIVALAAGRPAQLRNKLLMADFSYHSMEIISFE